MKDIYKTLEFDLIKNELLKYSYTEIGRNKLLSLIMFNNEEDLINELNNLDKMMGYINKYRSIHIHPHKDLSKEFALLKKGSTLNEEFFYEVLKYLENAHELLDEVIKDEGYIEITKLISSLEECDSLRKKISSVITKDLLISDNASNTLFEIRRSIKIEESSKTRIMSMLLSKYKEYLNNERVVLRNSTFVLPIKTSYKNKVNGIVIDESDTGLTSFIEPSEIISINNKIERLKEKEQEEIIRILEELSSLTSSYLPSIELDQEIISYLDFLSAKANFSLDNNYLVPKIIKEKKISLLGARHPLINKDKVVSNSYILDQEKIMVITGPNAGGKTVSLKVIGLLILMGQCGLAIPTIKQGEFSYFENIFVDIGDNQSLIDNLSTFSGHIKNIIEIINNVNDKSLVILDELGTGTSPLEGEALGIGVIEYLHKVGSFLVLTSHFDGLKNFALEKDYILNASMAFDEEKILPTYHLRLGVGGKSYGLQMASLMGLKKEVLTYSKNYIDNKQLEDKEITLKILESKISDNELLQVKLLEKEELLNKKIKSLENEKRLLEKEKEKIKLDAESLKEEIILETKNKIDKIYEDFNALNDIKLHEVISSKRKLDLLLEEEENERKVSYIPSINDQVRIIDFGVVGKVTRINGDKVSVLSHGVTYNVKTNQIEKEKITKPVGKLVYTPPYKLDHKVPLECNIVGYHIEEGIREIDKYLDDAIVANYSEVRIIHGHGTGKLRSAVHDYLKHKKGIKSYRLGGLGEGGVGATVVYLK